MRYEQPGSRATYMSANECRRRLLPPRPDARLRARRCLDCGGMVMALGIWERHGNTLLFRDAVGIRLQPRHIKVAWALLLNLGKMMSLLDLISVLYPDPWAEPDASMTVVRSAVCQMRPALAGIGLLIHTNHTRGYMMEALPNG